MTTRTIQEKRRPSTYVEGNKSPVRSPRYSGLTQRFSSQARKVTHSLLFIMKVNKIPNQNMLEGNFDIDAGDGGDHLGPTKSQKITKTYFVRERFILLGHFSKQKNYKISLNFVPKYRKRQRIR